MSEQLEFVDRLYDRIYDAADILEGNEEISPTLEKDIHGTKSRIWNLWAEIEAAQDGKYLYPTGNKTQHRTRC